MALKLSLSLVAGLLLWLLIWFGGGWLFNTSRPISYDAGAPRNWPVLYDVHFNGAEIIPWGFEVADWTADTSYGGGGSVSGRIPRQSLFNRSEVSLQVVWMEWTTGEAWTAEVAIDHPEELHAQISLYFEADGQFSVYRPNAALREGGLGRPATHDDYELIARTCGTWLAEDAPLFAELSDARARNFGIDVDRVLAADAPPPPPTECSAGAQ